MRSLIFPINITLILLTVAGYFIFLWPGIICHLLLGAFQLSCMLGYLITRKDNTQLENLQVYIYAGITVPLVLAAVISWNEDLLAMMVVGSVPLAIYFSGIIYQIEQKYNQAEN
ncbi:hypothetical protein [Gilvibacter sediminis]|uniref:hypothetical protein n=1 Tax=Gilvibacter sediminis TaxID=379071 RepID=UPI00234FDEC2|nr:hypothetical protein [Gilvibacter sediminis]MDC7997594.1 hypothetical protein [Gilvibacter sediminis]